MRHWFFSTWEWHHPCHEYYTQSNPVFAIIRNVYRLVVKCCCEKSNPLVGAPLVGACSLLVFALIGCQPSPSDFRGVSLIPVEKAPLFTLTDHQGELFHLQKHRGKVLLLFFGFTHCSESCPKAMRIFDDLHRQLGNKSVDFVFISIDPEHDNPAILESYVRLYDYPLIALTGERQKIEKVYTAYGVYRKKQENKTTAEVPFFDHTDTLYIIDKQGNWRLNHNVASLPEDILYDLNILLRE